MSDTWTTWLIEPRDPLIVRDGRPFGPDPGARAASLPFPSPSTIIGGLRHKAALLANGSFDHTMIDTILQMMLRGPLLVALADPDTSTEPQIAHWYASAPADAVVIKPDTGGEALIKQLRPLGALQGEQTNMPDGLDLVGMVDPIKGKADDKALRFWHWKHFAQWLMAPSDGTPVPNDFGLRGLENDERMHVSVVPETQTAREGFLFQTRGLSFTWRDREAAKQQAFRTQRLALATAVSSVADTFTHFAGGLSPLGGERRLMRWQKAVLDWPTPPAGLFDRIVKDKHCRIVLLTPALFKEGYRPPVQWKIDGLTLHVRAAAVPRAQIASGWDMAADNGTDAEGRSRPKGKPKPTRRLAPAGSVYFVQFDDNTSNSAIHDWLQRQWLTCVSDVEQDRRDGFGLTVFGSWTRELTMMEG